MARKKGSTTLDTMLKTILQHYDLPTRKDIDRLLARMNRIETLIKASEAVSKRSFARARTYNRLGLSASDGVLDVIRKSPNGVDFKGIQKVLDLDDKKLRNIIFRLNKIGRIKRKNRGTYIAV